LRSLFDRAAFWASDRTTEDLQRVESVYLMTTNQQKFYERIGFEENRSTTMVLHNQPIVLPGDLAMEWECDVKIEN
jgi:hypothetical protein